MDEGLIHVQHEHALALELFELVVSEKYGLPLQVLLVGYVLSGCLEDPKYVLKILPIGINVAELGFCAIADLQIPHKVVGGVVGYPLPAIACPLSLLFLLLEVFLEHPYIHILHAHIVGYSALSGSPEGR